MEPKPFSRNHISYTAVDMVTEICQPLFKTLNLSYFNYYRIYNNGERLRLCTNSFILERYYLEKWYEISIFETCAIPSFDTCILWNSAQEEYRASFKKQLRELYGVNDMLSIVKSNEDYMDIYDFATDDPQILLNDIYFQQGTILERFIQYFNISVSIRIPQAMKERFILPLNKDKKDQYDHCSQNTSELQTDSRVKEFYKLMVPQYLCLATEKRDTVLNRRETESLVNFIRGLSAKQIAQRLKIFYKTLESHMTAPLLSERSQALLLSHRENEIVDYLLKGKTAKETARLLFISYRTVERHLEKIKEKLNCRTKFEIVSKLLQEAQ